MAKSPVQVTVALLLAAVYAIVGGTGPSLHYLLSGGSPSGRSTDGKPKPRQGYFHCHGPDFHCHYHSWEIDEETEAEANQQPADGHASCHRLQHPHEPHACPALAVVANMKLGAGRVEVLPVDNPKPATLAQISPRLQARTSSSPHLPRGPPQTRVA